MSEKEYDSVQYISQEIQSALQRFIKKKTSGEINVKYFCSSNNDLSTITYDLIGLRTRLTILKDSNDYHLIREIGKKDSELEKRSEEKMEINRSKKGRISKSYTDAIIRESIKDLGLFLRGSKQ